MDLAFEVKTPPICVVILVHNQNNLNFKPWLSHPVDCHIVAKVQDIFLTTGKSVNKF